MTNDVRDELAVRNLIARFAGAFDLKAWDVLGGCLADRVETDYSDLRGTPPETMTRDRFVELRRSALQSLATHHLAGNVEVTLHGGQGEARVSMVIYRRAGDEVLDTHCLYRLGVRKIDGAWRITAIAQTVFWSHGNPAIHRGIPPA